MLCVNRNSLLSKIILFITISLMSGIQPSLASAQQSEAPNIAEMEANLEEAFNGAMAMKDVEPSQFMMTWGVISMSAMVLANAKAAAAGTPLTREEGMAATEQLLKRWQQEQPEAGGPHLFRAFSIRDQELKRSTIISLLDQYPDDLLVVWQAAREIRAEGDSQRATQVLESFFTRHPNNPQRFSLLAQDASNQPERYAEILERWGREHPGDPALVKWWMLSPLARKYPDKTSLLLTDFFEKTRSDDDTLHACLQVKRSSLPNFQFQAQRCVARIAGDPDAPPEIAKQAISALAGSAAEAGDWSGLQEALDSLDQQARRRALIGAAGGLTATRCSEIVDLLRAAYQLPRDENSNDNAVFASALRKCSDYPRAQVFLMDIIREAPLDRLYSFIGAWITRSNRFQKSYLPAGVTKILEDRLRTEPNPKGLYRPLDLIYQISDPEGKRFALLQRWYAETPEGERFGQETTLALANEFWMRGDPQSAMELLKRELKLAFFPDTAELLWEILVTEISPKRGEEYAKELTASEQEYKITTGYTLSARSALLNEDQDQAEAFYWKALETSRPDDELVIEFLRVVEMRADLNLLESSAQRICEKISVVKKKDPSPTCAADYLNRVGNSAAAALALSQTTELPNTIDSLRQLGLSAHKSGDLELAEKAFRKMITVKPTDQSAWGSLLSFFEKEERVDDLRNLLIRVEETFPSPQASFYRLAGRAHTAAGEPRQAISYLIKGRGLLPEGKEGDWNRSWINQELREAYEKLGSDIWEKSEAAVKREQSRGLWEKAVTLILEAEDEQNLLGLAQLKNLAKRPDALAVEILVLMRATGLVEPRDLSEAAQYHQRAANLGSDGFLWIRNRLGESESLVELVSRVLDRLEELATQKDYAASALLARLHFVGLGQGSDKYAVKLARLGAQHGEALAMRTLYHAYGQGRGVEQDGIEARRWLIRGAEAGDSFCMNFYGNALIQGESVDRDVKEGLNWLKRSAEAGNYWALSDLGHFYDEGWYGLPADPKEALVWKKQLADLDFFEAIGWMDYHGYRR